ncbi:hypothetical protein, partial [Escherichia coli]|uniref:hypothetical protein n=1 Tax=Escherichia coli TaxID=562 RepID=UPI003B7B345B
MQHFLHGLKFNVKSIVRHHHYTTMNELLHHALEAESQLAEEAQLKTRAATGRFAPRAAPYTPAASAPAADHPSTSSKPAS